MQLMREGNVDSFRELEALTGKLDLDGKSDEITGCQPVARQALSLFLQHVDKTVGQVPVEAEAAGTVDAATTDDAVTLTEAAAHDPAIYRAARDAPAAAGKDFRIVGDAREGEILPGEFTPVGQKGR
jgi:hypothetical protein